MTIFARWRIHMSFAQAESVDPRALEAGARRLRPYDAVLTLSGTSVHGQLTVVAPELEDALQVARWPVDEALGAQLGPLLVVQIRPDEGPSAAPG